MDDGLATSSLPRFFSKSNELITSVLVHVYLEDAGVWRELNKNNDSVFVHLYFDHNSNDYKLIATDGLNMLIDNFVISPSLALVRSSKNFLHFTDHNDEPVYGMGFDKKEDVVPFMLTVDRIIKHLQVELVSTHPRAISTPIPWSVATDSTSTFNSTLDQSTTRTLSTDYVSPTKTSTNKKLFGNQPKRISLYEHSYQSSPNNLFPSITEQQFPPVQLKKVSALGVYSNQSFNSSHSIATSNESFQTCVPNASYHDNDSECNKINNGNDNTAKTPTKPKCSCGQYFYSAPSLKASSLLLPCSYYDDGAYHINCNNNAKDMISHNHFNTPSNNNYHILSMDRSQPVTYHNQRRGCSQIPRIALFPAENQLNAINAGPFLSINQDELSIDTDVTSNSFMKQRVTTNSSEPAPTVDGLSLAPSKWTPISSRRIDPDDHWKQLMESDCVIQSFDWFDHSLDTSDINNGSALILPKNQLSQIDPAQSQQQCPNSLLSDLPTEQKLWYENAQLPMKTAEFRHQPQQVSCQQTNWDFEKWSTDLSAIHKSRQGDEHVPISDNSISDMITSTISHQSLFENGIDEKYSTLSDDDSPNQTNPQNVISSDSRGSLDEIHSKDKWRTSTSTDDDGFCSSGTVVLLSASDESFGRSLSHDKLTDRIHLTNSSNTLNDTSSVNTVIGSSNVDHVLEPIGTPRSSSKSYLKMSSVDEANKTSTERRGDAAAVVNDNYDLLSDLQHAIIDFSMLAISDDSTCDNGSKT